MEKTIQAPIQKQRSPHSTRLQLSLFSTLCFNLVIVAGVAPVEANELDMQQPSTATVVDRLAPAATAVTTVQADLATVKVPSAIAAQPTVEALPIVVESPAPVVPPLIMEPTSEVPSTNFSTLDHNTPTISKQARDLLGAPTTQTLSQAEPQTSTEGQPSDTSPPKPVNNPLLPPPGWRFEFEPYLFVPFKLDGDIFFGRGRGTLFPNRPGEILSTSGFSLNVNARLSDVTANLTNIFGISGRVQAWNGDVGIVADGLYVNTKFNSSSDGGVLTLRDRIDLPVPGFELDTQTTISSFALAGSYRIVTVPLRTVTDPANPSNYYPAISFEALVGARYASVFQSVDFENGPDFEFFGNKVNPMLGGTVKLLLNDKFALYFRGDTSGFGSDPIRQYYNLHAGIDWKFSGSFALRLAYRINQIEFVKKGVLDGENGLRLRSEGVQLGVAWQF